MSRAYSDIAFTPAVRAMQTRMGSRAGYAPLDETDDRRDFLTEREAEFIHARDGFYQASVSETGWPYVQFRGGPAGFLKVLDAKTIGYADFRGNLQYISVGNLQGNDRVSIILMDYANQRRLKLLGRVRFVTEAEDPALIAQLELPHYRARVERAVIISIEAYDWNCPKHITPRFTEGEINDAVAPMREELARLQQELASLKGPAQPAQLVPPKALGSGPLVLTVSGIRQLTPRVRAYELRAMEGGALPAVQAGAHIDVPVRLANGTPSTRRYSISSNPSRRDAFEIAVLLEDAGSGGSAAVHADFNLGMTLHCGSPGNDFPVHPDARPSVLIAGGIGITAIKSMALQLQAQGQPFELHYAVRSGREAAYLDRMQRQFGAHLKVYAGDQGQRLDVAAVLAQAPADAQFYVCGPNRLIEAVQQAALTLDGHSERVHFERFTAPRPEAGSDGNKALTVTLQRSGKRIAIQADQSILEGLEAAGVAAPSACRTGSCSTCAVKVLSGEPEHRDSALSAEERAERMCICVSRAKGSDLTLDL